MHVLRRFRIPAICCAIAVMLCELISQPYTTMGVCDDGPYLLIAQHLAATGHLVYNGWPAAMLGWQLYLGAAFIKLFGFSFTVIRSSTLFVAVLLAFLFQRTLVAASLSERNATIATLALVLSPLYLLLSVTFMSDIFGLFAIVVCIYGCLRALEARSDHSTIAWLCFAIAANALCGTARQIAWLGTLVMLPSTLWLLRLRRRILWTGAAATLAGALFIFACMHWFSLQPYIQPEPLIPPYFSIAHTFTSGVKICLELPFLILPLIALFVPQIFSRNRRSILVVSLISLAYSALSLHRGSPALLEPAIGDWVTVAGMVHEIGLHGNPPLMLHTAFRAFLTLSSLGGVLGLAVSFFQSRPSQSPALDSSLSSQQLGIVLGPFCIAYMLFLTPRAAALGISDRYVLGLAVPVLIWLARYDQDRFQPRFPLGCVALVAIMAALGVIMTHNTFALYRARVAVADELRAAGVPDTSSDLGWENNLDVELEYANHINFPTIVVPAHAYTPTPPPPAGPCTMFLYDYTPHIHPLYGLSYEPNACDGPAPFAPVHYARWAAGTPGTLYVVRYTPSSQP